jgi:HSP20 family protein
VFLGSECRSIESHFLPGSPGRWPSENHEENDMTTTASWDAFEDLRSAQDELMRMSKLPVQWLNQFGPHFGNGYVNQAWVPTVDITERKDAYLVMAELPGIGPSDLEVTFSDGLLTIQGERHATGDAAGNGDARGDDKVHRAERRYGAFRRSIALPSHVQADKIEATTQDGVLQILVPKSQEARAKHIQVHAGRSKSAVTATAVKNGG